MYSLFCLIYFVMLVAHFCACMWSYLGRVEIESYGYRNTWLDFYHISDETWQIKYLYSIYYIAITSMTVGYGDIVPVDYLIINL